MKRSGTGSACRNGWSRVSNKSSCQPRNSQAREASADMRVHSLPIWSVDCSKTGTDEVLDWCSEQEAVSHILLVVRLDRRGKVWRPIADKQAEENRQRFFDPKLVTEFLASGWPGTALVRHPALVGVFDYDLTLKRTIARIGPRFSDWYGPDRRKLPEDICVFASEGERLVFASVTHDLDGWVFTKKCPPFGAPTPGWIRRGFKKFIFSGPFFCRQWSSRGRLYRPLRGAGVGQ